jgi:DNA-binding NtrC family response regulator
MRELLDRLIAEMVKGRITLDEGRRAFESRFIQHVLDSSDGHITRAADRLGVHRNTLSRKIEEYRIRTR